MKIHTFKTSTEALVFCTAIGYKINGDLLIIPSEDVIAVSDFWPFAITKNSGLFDTLKTDQSFKKKLNHNPLLIEAYILYGSLIGEDGVHIK